MKHLVQFETNDGPILVEVDEPERLAKVGMVMRGDDDNKDEQSNETIDKANHTFEQALDRVKPIADGFVGMVKKLVSPPDEMEVQFGLKLSAKAGVIVASAGMEANYTVTMTWKNSK